MLHSLHRKALHNELIMAFMQLFGGMKDLHQNLDTRATTELSSWNRHAKDKDLVVHVIILHFNLCNSGTQLAREIFLVHRGISRYLIGIVVPTDSPVLINVVLNTT